MTRLQIIILTSIAMIAFAGNSLLCRFALDQSKIDPASFTTIRLVAGAVMLWLIATLSLRNSGVGGGSWYSAFALFTYAASFSFAYLSLTAATGALILFGAVQVTMIAYAIYSGERLTMLQSVGLLLSLAGLIGLLWPGLAAPPLLASALMLLSGVAWAIYTLRGRGSSNPLEVTAANFAMSVPFTVILSVVTLNQVALPADGVGFAIASGAITSGIGYAIWYWVLPTLKATHASIIQLSVPVIAVFGGAVLLNESIGVRLIVTSAVILGGIALVMIDKGKRT